MIVFCIILAAFYFCGGAFCYGMGKLTLPQTKAKWLLLFIWPIPFCIHWGASTLHHSKPEVIIAESLIDMAVDACTINYNNDIYQAVRSGDLEQLKLLYPLIQSIRLDYYQSFETLPRVVRVKDHKYNPWDMVWGEEIPPDWEHRI